MPLRAAASTVASESTATVTRAPHSASARRRSSSTDSLASSRSSPSPARASPSSSRGVAPVKPRWPRSRLLARERGALVRLHVRAQALAGQRGGHRVEVARERARVDDERGSREVGDTHVREDGTCRRRLPRNARRPTTTGRPPSCPPTPQRVLPDPGRALDRGARRAARRWAPTSASTSSRTSAASAGTCCGGPGPRSAPTRATWRSRPTTSTSDGRSGCIPTAPAKATRPAARTRASAPGRKTSVTPRAPRLISVDEPVRRVRASARTTTAAGRSTIRARSSAIRRDRRDGADRTRARRRVRHRHVDGRARRARATRWSGSTCRPRCCARRAARAGVHYLLGSAERMPFARRVVRRGHVLLGRALVRPGRVLRRAAPRAAARARGSGSTTTTSSARWSTCPSSASGCATRCTRYPLPPRNPQVGDPRSLEPAGFEKVGDELFADDIAMTHAELTDYQLTISNFVDAVERGTPRAELEAWSLDSTAPLFAGRRDPHRPLPRLDHLLSPRRP